MPEPETERADAAPLSAAVVVVPTYNNAATIGGVLSGVEALSLPMIVVDDGSTDGTAAVLSAWARAHPLASLTVISHPANRGKAGALRTGFAAALTAGCTHAISIDSDGQLDPADIAKLLEVCLARPRALVLGVRPVVMESCPARCLAGRRFSSLAVYAQTGRRLADTQCGLRAYPLELVRATRCVAGRYSFEAEIITRALWAGFEVAEVPVSCRYFPVGERVSHFRPVLDSLRQGGVHARLTLRAMAPMAGRGRATAKEWPRGDRARWWWELASWFNPVRAWRAACTSEIGRLELAVTLGLGAWIGTLPFFGLHTLMSLYAAWRLHLHPAAMVLGSQVSIPPLGVALGVASVWVGSILTTGRTPRLPEGPWTIASMWESAWMLVPAWIVGSVIVGFVVALAVCGAAMVSTRGLRREEVSRTPAA